MTKETYTNPMSYTYHAERKGAKYNIEGKWANHGEYLESVAKCHRGLDYIVNPTTSFDKGSDIESEHTSVKSSHGGLGSIYGETKEEILKEYFERVASTHWIWMTDCEEEITEYHMNKEEFKEFVQEWSKLEFTSGKKPKQILRFRYTSHKMIQWFEERVA